MYDAIVIGAGPAGLQAALTLGRMHRSTLLLDSGEYRNGRVLHMHNVIAADGMPPAQFRATAKEQLAPYADVEVRDVAARAITGSEGDFTVELGDGSDARGRQIILATGIVDDLPPIRGLDSLWGTRAFSCPFCDGHEHAGRAIAIFGPAARAEHLISLLGRIVGEITVFPGPDGITDEEASRLAERGAAVERAAVTSVERAAVTSVEGTLDGARVSTDAGDTLVAGIFVASGTARQRAPFAEQLGLSMLPSGSIEIDEFGRTSAPGIFAAGDLAHRASVPGAMAAVLLAAAAGQLAAVGIIQSLVAAEG